jgi:putative ABC transport system ATP-binding protein
MPPKQLVGMRRSIGFIFQSHNLFESLTAYQNVQMALTLHGYSKQEQQERVTEMLTALGLTHRMHAKPNALSGGQRQRVAVACALVHRPKLVLADEPTAALDKEVGRDVVNVFKKLAAEDRSTILLVTHDNRILDVADRIVNMVDGHIVSDVLVAESVVICQFLMQCPVFAGLTPSILSDMADEMSLERYTAGTVLLRQGDAGDKFYLIRTGRCNVSIDHGKTRTAVNTLGEGEFFGEIALMTGEPRSATVVATEAIELYTLSKDDFQAAIEASATFREQLLKVFFQRQERRS